MDLPFKYTTSFAETVVLSELDKKDLTSFASLTSLKDIMPEGIDLEKNIDLVGVAFNAAVANKFNKNGDGIDSSTAIAIKDYFIHKPANIEHNKQKVVGHIVGSSLSKFGTNELISIINVKFFNWKRKQEGPIQVNNSFFHKIAHNAAIDEINLCGSPTYFKRQTSNLGL